MLVPKYKDMDGEVILVVLQQESFIFPKYGRDLKEKKKKRRRGKREFGLKKEGGRVVFKCGIESGIFLNSSQTEHDIFFFKCVVFFLINF